jgi:aminoglycoside 6'-N-acetyltransferase I
MAVRPLELVDHPEWLRLRKALWPDCSDDTHAFEMRLYAEQPEKSRVFVFERRGGKLGGFLEVSIRDRVDGSFCRRVGYCEAWYVDADLRRRGIGRLLFDAAEKWAVGKGLTELASDCELGDRQSQTIQRAMGFEETFRLVHFLKKLQR